MILFQMVQISRGIYIHRDVHANAMQVCHDGCKMVRVLTKACFTLEDLKRGSLAENPKEGLHQLDLDVVDAIIGMYSSPSRERLCFERPQFDHMRVSLR